MSETLWYYTVSVEHIAGIMQSPYGIFEGSGKILWFTSNEEYQVANTGQQYRIRVSRHGSVFSSYQDLERRHMIDPTDEAKGDNPDQWFGTRQPVSSDQWTSVEKLTNDGWVPIDEPQKQYLRDLALRRDVQKTLKKPESHNIAK
jgi:hypothetical protein